MYIRCNSIEYVHVHVSVQHVAKPYVILVILYIPLYCTMQDSIGVMQHTCVYDCTFLLSV